MHHHHHHHDHDEHSHRNLQVEEEPLDAANQALADALRVSFKILKTILCVLVVLYCVSNVKRIESHEQAIRLRLGVLMPKVYEPGLAPAWPYPLEQIVTIPTKQVSTLLVSDHNFSRSQNEVGKDLDNIARSESRGLDPVMDGALMTSDQGLVHLQWQIAYEFDDLAAFVTNVRSDQTATIEAAENLIRTTACTVGVHVASEMTADEVIRTNVTETKSRMKRQMNERLAAINSGLIVTAVEIMQPTPPISVRRAFVETQKAENRKREAIQKAEQDKEKLLNDAAGGAYRTFEQLFAQLDAAQIAGDQNKVQSIEQEIDNVLLTTAEGRAGQMIKQADAYRSRVVGRIQGDLELYQLLIPEYKRSPELLIARLWEETRQEILSNPYVVKMYRPFGIGQLRLQLTRDPEQRRIDEAKALQREQSGNSKDEMYVPVGVFES